jgi:lipopolysaccharide transport system permease protein
MRMTITSEPPSLLSEAHAVLKFPYLLKRLVWRDLKVRYNHTALGILWNVIQPLTLMIIFVLFLGLIFRDNTHGIPSPIYTYSALCLWHFFSRALMQGGTSFISFQSLLTKVYFPRLIIPLSYVLGAAVDFSIAYCLLIAFQFFYGLFIFKQFIFVPIIFTGLFIFSVSIATFFATLSAKYKDTVHVLPLLVQLWVFCCPIMYPYSLVPERYLWFYNLNPMVGYVQMFRWATTTASPFPSMGCWMSSLVCTGISFVVSLWVFQRMSLTLIDEL